MKEQDRQPEPDDVFPIRIGQEPFNIDRYNTTLFTFIGEMATRNHIFIQTGAETDNGAIGTYLFAESPPNNPSFSAIVDFMVECDFPMILNMNRIPECDERAYQHALEKEMAVPDFLPEDWENGTDPTDL